LPLDHACGPYSIAQEVSDIKEDLLQATINADGKNNPDGLEFP
jgi:hypothetical protein